MSTEVNKTYWDCETGQCVTSTKVDLFLTEIEEICKKHGLSISHEDGHGSFIIENYNQKNIEWLNSCSINLSKNV